MRKINRRNTYDKEIQGKKTYRRRNKKLKGGRVDKSICLIENKKLESLILE